MANGALSGYFEKEKEKADRVGPSPYASSAGAAPAALSAAPAAPAAAPSSQKAGGTGFVNFGTYFGANAPAIQAQAQKAVEKAKDSTPTATPGLTAQAMPTTMQAGALGNVKVQGTPRSGGSYESRIAEASRQFEALSPMATTGDVGNGTSLFDQMLGGATTQQAAQQEQQRLGALRTSLGEQQAQAVRQQQETAAAEQKAKDEKAYQAWWDEERRKAEYANQQQQAKEGKSWWDTFWDSASIGSLRS